MESVLNGLGCNKSETHTEFQWQAGVGVGTGERHWVWKTEQQYPLGDFMEWAFLSHVPAL